MKEKDYSMAEEVKLKPKQKPHYVDNKKFLVAMTEYRELRIKAEEEGKRRPTVTNYIGECYLKIANHLSYRPNFINYTYRDDMISDGIENCLQYMDNFDPEKSKNPFAYFTQISWFAFLRRIAKEKRQHDIKFKYIEMSGFDEFVTADDNGEYDSEFIEELRTSHINYHNDKSKAPDIPHVKHKILSQGKNLEKFMDREELSAGDTHGITQS